MTTPNGTLSFGGIPKLQDNWWDDPSVVWKTWKQDTYYLWGANAGNYTGIPIGGSLHGDGLAGAGGPTWGRAHPHYVGVITMSESDLPKNDAVFQDLARLMGKGNHVLVPSFHGKLSLGTGIGKSLPPAEWAAIQKYVLEQICALAANASSVDIPHGTFWPDVRTTPETPHAIVSVADLKALIAFLGGTAHHASLAVPAALSGQTSPAPRKVQVAGQDYTLVAFYYPDGHNQKTAPCDDHYHAGCFGNFYPCTVTVDYPDPSTGKKITPTPQFRLSEAAFQALKWWGHASIRNTFESFTHGPETFDYSQGPPDGIGADLTYAGLDQNHDVARVKAMEMVLRQKYTENADLQAALLSTGDAYLIEHATGAHDKFWSDGGRDKQGNDVHGLNKLGRTLMKIRGEFPGGKPAPGKTGDDDSIVAEFKQAVEYWTAKGASV